MWNTQPIGNNMSSVWNAQPLGHSVPPMSPNRVIPTSPSTNPQLYAVQLTGPCSPTHAQHPVFLAPRSVSMPLPLSQHQFTAPYPELKSPTSPLFTPVAGPISPLLLSPVSIEGMTPQGNGGGIAAMNSPLRFSPDEAKKCEEHYSESVKKQIKEATRGMVDKACQHMGKRIRHVHICAGCGKKRPEEYQKAHPLKRGQIPERNYCDSCLHDASATERSDTDDTSEANHAEEAPGNTPNGTQKGSKNYFDRKLTNKSKRFGLLSNILPRPVTSEDHPEQSDSPSSANESEIKVSATTRVAGRKVKQRRRRHPPPSGEEDARINEGNVPSPELGEPVHHQGIHSRDGKQPTPKDELHTEQSSPMAHSKRGVLEEIISGTQPYHSAGKTQGKDTGSASEAAATQKRSGLPRLFSSKAAPKTKPDICAKTVPGTLGAAVLVDEAGNNQPEAVNRANKYPGPRNEVQSAADAYDAYDSSFSAEQPAGDARHTRHEYKYTQERKLRDRGHSQLRTRPHENSRSEQPVRDTQASQRGCSGCRRVQRPRADERAQGTQEEHRGAVRSNESATPYNVRHNTDDGRGGSREETDKVEENTQSLDESNLAASAEFFNDFTGAGGGSDTTPFSIPSFVTGTQPSEVSHNSHQRLDENVAIAYEQAEALITDQVANQPHCPVELPGKKLCKFPTRLGR
ncbi:hypothetical protein GGR54DRAFT_609900 [Hypoxylon sp. NC1633]|nr:hypothetical protein GGR54DRAFT_609900 [Hypoxylon sp. NC1633]